LKFFLSALLLTLPVYKNNHLDVESVPVTYLSTEPADDPYQSMPEVPIPVPEEQSEPLKSGQISVLPWESDESFKIEQDKNGTPVLMAAYRTVLKDPLPGEEYNVHLAARILAGTVVKPGQIFSQNTKIGPYTESRGFKKGPTYIGSRVATTIGGGVCKIATTLYNTAILSNLQIIERYPHSMPVPYVPYGQDATVAYGARDFRFKNNTSHPIMIWAQGIDNILYIAFYGASEPPKIEWHHETLSTQKAPIIYTDNPNLQKGEERMVMEGADGALVRSWITIHNPDGTFTVKELGNSYYKPIPYLFEKGS